MTTLEARPAGDSSLAQPILVTGVTGYIGGTLVPHLLAAGYRVRVMVRDLNRLPCACWRDQVEYVQGDALKPETLPAALVGCGAAYYFIHSLFGGSDFVEQDVRAARNFCRAAKDAGVGRLIYLGGLGDPEQHLSEHLRSRQQTGAALREAGVPVTEFRAAIIIGSGSASFEMIRYMTERVPPMILPRWVYSRIQPIAIDDVMTYLVEALRTPESAGQVIEIGGADVLTYGDTMAIYARVRGLRRLMLPVPVLTPNLSSHWVGWMTPVSAKIARPLIEGLRNEVVVRDDKARRLFPMVQPMGYEPAVRLALADLQPDHFLSRWREDGSGESPCILSLQEGMIIERRVLTVQAPAETLYDEFASLGGTRGWLYADWLWKLRGAADRAVGGCGLRKGRTCRGAPQVGDQIDYFRVEIAETGRRLRLRAEMKMPGDAWLQFDARPLDAATSRLLLNVFFAPRGLFGLIYWYVLYPIHRIVFTQMSRRLARNAELQAASAAKRPSSS